MPERLSNKYNRKHLNNIIRTNQRIKDLYGAAIQQISLTASRLTYKGGVFDLDKYPALKTKIDNVLAKMHTEMYAGVVNSMEVSWNFANEKNDLLVDRRLAGRKPTKEARRILYDPNEGAMNAFIDRKEKGMELSKRVWNTLDPFRVELEQALGMGLNEGKGAKELAKDLTAYLNNPDKLFRKVRDADGNLQLSKKAKEFNPGSGVYRSSYKNALRLARTETNMAYQRADHERWKQLPFVKGFEVRLSNSHPKYDICDSMKGEYPKEFVFSGWHPNCLCSAIPIMVSDEEYDKIEDQILGLSDDVPAIDSVKDIPSSAKQWIQDNRARLEGWSNKPYWVRDNRAYVINTNPSDRKPIPASKVPMPPKPPTIQEKVLQRNRAVIDKIKETYAFPEDLLQHLGEEIKFEINNRAKGAWFDPRTKTIVIAKNVDRVSREYFNKTLLPHEIGHAIHNTRGINTGLAMSPEYTKHIKELRDIIKGKEFEIQQQLQSALTKHYSDDNRREQIAVIADTLGGLTKGKYGWGHEKSYYPRYFGGEAEVFAHSISLLKVDNEFSNITPEMKTVISKMKEFVKKLL